MRDRLDSDTAFAEALSRARSLYRDGQQPTTAELADQLRTAYECEHKDEQGDRWTYVEHDGKTWNRCEACGLLELWEGGMLVKTDHPALSELVKRGFGHVPVESFAAAMTALERCPFCDHEWTRHDPEDGMCDAHSSEGIGPCSCGRDLVWMQQKIAALSKAALEAAADARIGHGR